MLDSNTHGLDWRQHLRARSRFAMLVTRHTATDRRQLRQYAYAKQLGKPIYLLVLPGVTVPSALRGEPHTYYVQDAKEAARILTEIWAGAR